MLPVAFNIPFINWPIPGYGLALMVSFLLAIIWAARRGLRSGANPDVLLNCGFVALIAGVVGCRTMYVIHNWHEFSGQGNWLQTVWAIIDVRRGGLEYYGGFIFTTLAVMLWLRFKERVSLRWYFDIIAPSVALGLGIGRVGCFLNGCCYGSTCQLSWAVQFPFGSPAQMDQWRRLVPGAELPKELIVFGAGGVTTPITRESLAASDERIAAAQRADAALRPKIQEAERRHQAATSDRDRDAAYSDLARLQSQVAAHAGFGDIRANMRKFGLTAAQIREIAARHASVRVHPAQLYSTITGLILALLLNSLYWHRTRDGQVILALFLLEPLTRVLLEIIRTDNPVDVLGFLTISQWLACLMVVGSLIGFAILRRLPPRSPRAILWTPRQEETGTGVVVRAGSAAGART